MSANKADVLARACGHYSTVNQERVVYTLESSYPFIVNSACWELFSNADHPLVQISHV